MVEKHHKKKTLCGKNYNQYIYLGKSYRDINIFNVLTTTTNNIKILLLHI
jgi:hypothetical protein